MSEIITTLHEKGTPENEIYPNIKGENIPDNAVTTPKVYNNAITSAKIQDGAITTSKIDDGAVTTAKIVNNAITTNKINDGAITTSKIDDGAVNTAKMANNSITQVKLQNGIINADKMAFHLYEHVYICYDSVVHIQYIIKFNSTTEPFTTAIDLFYYLNDTYGVNAPVAIQTNTIDLTDIFGYVNDSQNIEFTDTNDETFNSNVANVSITSYSQTLF